MKWTSFLLAIFALFNVKLMAQSDILFENSNNKIGFTDKNCQAAATLLKQNLDKISSVTFEITNEKIKDGIALEIIKKRDSNYFEISARENIITIKAGSDLYLEYGVSTLLEFWEIRKFTAEYTYYPEVSVLKYPKHKTIKQRPSFTFRGLLYPDIYNESFRKWHKLNWFLDDFGLWGHTFNKLVPPKEYFKSNPKMFALYNHQRNSESICYSNDTVFKVVKQNLTKAIAEKPNAKYFSVSQNDDVVYCECPDCKKLNQKYGSPQGAHYYFVNRVAKQFPKYKIATLAYLYSYQPPKNLTLAPNLYPIFCPIEADRAAPLHDQKNQGIAETLKKWLALSNNVIVWDYTVQFSNYLSPFPNLHTFGSNYEYFKNQNVYGVFAQGYADVPGTFSELRQYILAKLLWNSTMDSNEITSEFLKGYYGDAAPFIQEYLNILKDTQLKSNTYLDIYSGPITARNSFLNPQVISECDNLLTKATLINTDPDITERILKLRLDLEYVFFEQAKFYGKGIHGMYEKGNHGYVVKSDLEKRVIEFVSNCKKFGIYELSEGGLSPDEYLEQWHFITTNNVVDHLGETAKIEFATEPAPEFNAKKVKGLQDGIKGFKDFANNWTGWYGENAEIEIDLSTTAFNSIAFQCLEDQRHWIFLPRKVEIWGLKNEKWILLDEKLNTELTENHTINIQNYKFINEVFSNFSKIKLVLIQEPKIPIWRERKNKKPMVMIDEIILLQQKIN